MTGAEITITLLAVLAFASTVAATYLWLRLRDMRDECDSLQFALRMARVDRAVRR